MPGRFLRDFLADCSAAIAPMYALGLFAFIGIAGVGFDYGRMATMSSELQNAADQAALAAATQLNGQTDAMVLARDAAQAAFAAAASAYVNETRTATVDDDGDGDPRPITQLTFRFYSGYDYDSDAPTGPLDIASDDGEDARIVEVIVQGREVFYALTPIVGAISSGDITARAVATLQQSSCDVAPMMFCAPPGEDFAGPEDRGKGMRLHMLPNASDALAPGNFGFLDVDYDTSGNPNQRLGLGTASLCIANEIKSDPGDRAAEVPSFNTRFDRYENSANGLKCDATNGNFCAAPNVRQSYVQVQTHKAEKTADVPCAAQPTANGKWEHVPEGGYPREACIADGTCAFGDGVQEAQWGSYFFKNHAGVTPSSTASLTRFDTYQWEIDNGRLSPAKVNSTAVQDPKNGKFDVTNYCSYPAPQSTPSFTPDPDKNQKDRRILTVAAVDCTGLNGRAVVKIKRWIDIFLVDSARITTGDQEFVAEVVGPAARADGSSGFQFFGRGKAVLVQ